MYRPYSLMPYSRPMTLAEKLIEAYDLERTLIADHLLAADSLRVILVGYSYPSDTERQTQKEYELTSDTIGAILQGWQSDHDTKRTIPEDQVGLHDMLRTSYVGQELLRIIQKDYTEPFDSNRRIAIDSETTGDSLRLIYDARPVIHDLLRQIHMPQRYRDSAMIGGKRYRTVVSGRTSITSDRVPINSNRETND